MPQNPLALLLIIPLAIAAVWWYRRPDPKWWGKITPAPDNKNKKG